MQGGEDFSLLMLTSNAVPSCCGGELELVYSGSKSSNDLLSEISAPDQVTLNRLRTKPTTRRIPVAFQGASCAAIDKAVVPPVESTGGISQSVIGKTECSLVCRLNQAVPGSYVLHRYADHLLASTATSLAINKRVWLIHPEQHEKLDMGKDDDHTNPAPFTHCVPPPWWFTHMLDVKLWVTDHALLQVSTIAAVRNALDYLCTSDFRAKTDEVHDNLEIGAVLASSKDRVKQFPGGGAEIVLMHRAFAMLWKSLPPIVVECVPCLLDAFVRVLISSTCMPTLRKKMKEPDSFYQVCRSCFQRAVVLFQLATAKQTMTANDYLAALPAARASMQTYVVLDNMSVVAR